MQATETTEAVRCPHDACPRCRVSYRAKNKAGEDIGHHPVHAAYPYAYDPVTFICSECGFVFDPQGRKRLRASDGPDV